MGRLRGMAWTALVLGALSLAALVGGHLALTDIARGEEDVAREWLILQVGGLIILAFTVLGLVTLAGFLLRSRRR